jgi:hypothetical protein
MMMISSSSGSGRVYAEPHRVSWAIPYNRCSRHIGLSIVGASSCLKRKDTRATPARLGRSRKKADLPFLENFYAKEFTVGNMNGTESSRAQDLEMFSSGDMKPAVITDAQMKVSIYGEAAMVTGIEHLEGTYKGHAGRFDLRFANFFVFRDSRWQIIRHQATPIIDDKSGS